jgi:hypothetical protein
MSNEIKKVQITILKGECPACPDEHKFDIEVKVDKNNLIKILGTGPTYSILTTSSANHELGSVIPLLLTCPQKSTDFNYNCRITLKDGKLQAEGLPTLPSHNDKALLKYAEDAFVKSADTIRDFAKSMITLVSGFFAVYFALLKFIGIENVITMKIQISNSIAA